MSMDHQVQSLLKKWSRQPQIPIENLTPKNVRNQELKMIPHSGEEIPLFLIGNIKTTGLPYEIPIRIYSDRPVKGLLPTLIYFHGGGFVSGLAPYDKTLRAIAKKSGCLLLAIQYRLAPENKFPCAVNDSIEAFKWVVKHHQKLRVDRSRIGVAGDSAGGNLVVCLCNSLSMPYRNLTKFQILIYPMLDASMHSGSYKKYASGYGFTAAKSAWYFNQYLTKTICRKSPAVSPLFAQIPERLPRTFIYAAELDPLLDDSRRYFRKLKKNNISVTYKEYKGMIHGFLLFRGVIDKANNLINDITKVLKAQLEIQE